ncbi:MAG: single-stranded-DNA-specific exonuclease RecJ [Coriobacteriia bacterium]|nr:single-stranded-DNA-specific exonuclease RecJ [Coriobacteriia bacterium]
MTDSCSTKRWAVAPADPETVASLAHATGLSPVTARVLVARGHLTAEAVDHFLSPSLDRDWLDPELLPGMTAAADEVAAAVRAGERIVVFGDFDLDGISAAAVATRGLLALGADVSAIVPHRFREGYGLSEASIARVLECEPALVVTVDCGISSVAEVAMLAEAGVRVVVTDHHEPGDGVPVGVAVANPKLEPATCGSCDLSGAGVALKLVHAVGTRLAQPDGWRRLTDLATLGTVADIVPLTAENRALVADGVARMRESSRACIAALAAVGGATPESMTAESVAFVLAPRLNAAGRMADPQISLDLLLTDDPAEAERLSAALDECNKVRQQVEADLSEAARALAERTYHGERALVLAGEGWHEGVKGIVASRLVGAYRVPTVLLTVEDGVARGSGRSVGSVDLFRALESCSDIFERYGGHAAAVGCTLSADRVDEFRTRLLEHLDALPAEQFDSLMTVDAEVALEDVSVELGAELSQLEPFGHGNRSPLFASNGVFMNGRSKVGKTNNHLRFSAYDGVVTVPAIAFRCGEIDELVNHDAAVDLAYQISVDEWRGRTRVQLMVREFQRHTPDADAPAYELVEDIFAHADEILAREEYAGIADAPSFHTKLAGVTFEGRQDVLGRLAAGSPLRVVRQPDNPYDSNAIALFDAHGDQVGFLNRRLASALAATIDAGVAYDCEVTEVTGGEGDRSLGVNVLVSQRDARDTDDLRAAERAQRRAELASLSTPELSAELTRTFIGDRPLHDAQVASLDHLEAGRSTLTVMATGRGKSLIFHLHAARTALLGGRASVFVYPLRALVADQSFHLGEAFSDVGLTVRTVTGESSLGERDEAFAQLKAGELDVVLTTPEFLHIHSARFADSGRIGFLVVDEAHHVGMSRAGHRPAYARLGEVVEALGHPTVLAVTATADDATATTIRSSLGIESTVLDPTVRDNLRVEDRRDVPDKDGFLTALAARDEKTVVYVNSREQSVKLARMIRKRVPSIAMRTVFYNGGMSRSMRHAVERAFRNSEVTFVVATSAFGEGVNIPDVRNVVLYHLPFNAVEFNQMSGRAGRDGAMARIHLAFGAKDARINEMILSSLAPSRDDMATLYAELRDISADQGPGFEVTNAELSERCRRRRPQFALDERGVSSGLGVFRDLGFVTGEGHGAYRRLTFLPGESKVELESSARYAEGLDEIAEFADFKAWAMTAETDDLLARFNRPILPSS